MARTAKRGIDSRRKRTVLEKGQPYYCTDTGAMWVGDGKTKGGVPAPWRGYNKLPDTSYNDIVVDPNSITGIGGTVFATDVWLTNLRCVVADNNGGEHGYFPMQLPHGYVPGTDLLWHVHFTNTATITDGQTVKFIITFTKASIWGGFGATATATATFTNNAEARENIRRVAPAQLSGTGILANTHLIAGGAVVSGAGLTLSAIMYGRIERDPADTHASSVYLLSVDAHVQIERMGTEREYK